MYATDDIGDAVDATKAFLLPFDFHRWLHIAFVTFFLGGLGLNFSSPSVATGGGDLPAGPPPDDLWLIVGALGAVVLLVALAFAAVRGVMDLVLFESLREEEVDLGRFWSARWRQGLGLFVFRVVLTAVAVSLLALPVGMISIGGSTGGATMALGILLLIPVVIAVPLGLALVKGFTSAFVAPMMILEGHGVVDGWRRFWPILASEWREFAGYAVVNFVLVLAAGAVLSFAMILGALLLTIPFVPLAGLGMAVGNLSQPAGTAVLAIVGAVYGVGVIVTAAFAKAPLIVFLRYYALLVLGDVDDDADLIPVIRREVRTEQE